MVFTVTKSGTPHSASVIWAPENSYAPVPTTFSPQDTSSNYYFYSSVYSLLKCFNTAIVTASTAAGLTNPPLLTYDPISGYFSVFYPTTDFPTCSLSWNNTSAQYLANFGGTWSSATSFTPLIPNTTSYVTINSVTYIQLIQECPNITAWDSLALIQMTTSLNIIPEDTATGTSAFIASGATTNSQLTDILCDSGNGTLVGGSRSGLVEYIPVGVPRWINLRSAPFTGFNVTLSWQSKMGNFYPMVLPPGSMATMKMLFRHRSQRGYDTY